MSKEKEEKEAIIRIDIAQNIHREPKEGDMTQIYGNDVIHGSASLHLPADFEIKEMSPIYIEGDKTVSYLVKTGNVTFDLQVVAEQENALRKILGLDPKDN